MDVGEKTGFSVLGYFPGGRNGVENRIYGLFRERLRDPDIFSAHLYFARKSISEPSPKTLCDLRDGNRVSLTNEIIEYFQTMFETTPSEVFGEYTIPDSDMPRLEEWMNDVKFCSMGGINEPAADDQHFRIFMLTRAINELVSD